MAGAKEEKEQVDDRANAGREINREQLEIEKEIR